MTKRFIERRRVGRGFTYQIDGNSIKNRQEIKRLNQLRIPPAWRDVKISPSPRAKIQATGYDSAGRLQYIYNATFRAAKEREKYERILKFAKALPAMREKLEKDFGKPGLGKEKVIATIVKLMDEAYFRVGSEEYARANQHYGISTLRSKHVNIEGDSVTFDFIGKSGQRQIKKLTNRKLSNIIKRLDELPGHEVFKYLDEQGNISRVKSSDVNKYIKESMGEEFSAKDFRTWGGTLLATAELAAAEKVDNERERKKILTVCVKKVARRLGNTPAVTRSSYIDPRVINSYTNGENLSEIAKTVEKLGSSGYLSPEENCVLKLLES